MKYLWENRSDMDSMETFSNEQSINQIVRTGEFTKEQLSKIEKMLESPYFARIDFLYDGENSPDKIYIGRFSFIDDEHFFWVYDWRSPIAGTYYDFDLGPAYYEAPMGRIEGKLISKKQYKVRNGNLEYAVESNMTINDDVLQRELSKNSDQKMKNIVATIQREQNKIIRNEKADIIIIQGVAGSGKTSIALHRIAFFLYRYKNEIKAEDILIISPNKVFADYISNVLPELGEEPILELSMLDLAMDLLPENIQFEIYANHIDEIIEKNNTDKKLRTEFKSSMDFLIILENFKKYADENYFNPQDYKFADIVIDKEYIKRRFMDLKNMPIQNRLVEIASNISDEIGELNHIGEKSPAKNAILKKLYEGLKFQDPLKLYMDFYEFIHKKDLLNIENNTLEYADIFPFLYIKFYLESWADMGNIKHLIIDEMQDYTPVQYYIINKIYPCKKTILGDLNQNLNPFSTIHVDDFKNLYPSMEFVQIFTSYRSTFEIIEFAKKINSDSRIDSTPRHGEKPNIIHCSNEEDEAQFILNKINDFKNNNYATLGIVCKNTAMATKLYGILSKETKVYLLNSESTKFRNGVTISTIPMAKGLEFDEVIIPMVNKENYYSSYDRNLLYIATTRAMHKLTLTYNGSISDLIPNNE